MLLWWNWDVWTVRLVYLTLTCSIKLKMWGYKSLFHIQNAWIHFCRGQQELFPSALHIVSAWQSRKHLSAVSFTACGFFFPPSLLNWSHGLKRVKNNDDAVFLDVLIYYLSTRVCVAGNVYSFRKTVESWLCVFVCDSVRPSLVSAFPFPHPSFSSDPLPPPACPRPSSNSVFINSLLWPLASSFTMVASAHCQARAWGKLLL